MSAPTEGRRAVERGRLRPEQLSSESRREVQTEVVGELEDPALLSNPNRSIVPKPFGRADPMNGSSSSGDEVFQHTTREHED
eukprot:CAMPEP_0181410130 /NCGR_PEP_ID=MMETSP1110-20121109/7178_1 /TAXON_ID=174948 /ORGANISM="Symbiodinium sp., Strain CCMP421" /LENGTH=81 /DNA_ID=CAMNT_0023532663 /DNA_START=482 /DNA_END=728 /DNA_ORIENTATION=-